MAKLGIVLYHGIESGPELREYGRIAEAEGYDSLWVTERYFHEETFSLLGFLAAATEAIKLGVGVINPFTRNPALLGMAAATLDRISDGRFLLGLGRSDRSVIQGKMGIPYTEPLATLKDAVGILRDLLSGETVSINGRFRLHGVHLAVQPIQQPPPIYLAAIGLRSLRLAGAVADGVLLNAYVPTDYIRYAVREIRQAAEAAGRDPSAIDITCMLVIRLTDDPESLMPALKERIVRLLDEAHVGEILLEKGGFDPSILAPLRASVRSDGGKSATGLISDEMVRAFYVIGSAEECRSRIAEYRRAGVDNPLLLPRLNAFAEVADALSEKAGTSTP